MRLLVTGGAGYIGSVVTAAPAAGRAPGHGPRRPVHRARGRGAGRRQFVPGDIAERAGAVLADGDPYDGVLHFAAKSLVGESVEHPERYWRTNVAGTLALLDAMRANARAAAGVLLDRGHLRRARRGADRGDRADPADQPVRRLQAGRGHDDHVRGAGARARRGRACATSTWPARPAAQGERHAPETHLIPIALQVVAGRAAGVRGLRRRLPDPGRHLHPRLRARRRPGRGAPAGAGRGHRRASTGSATSATAPASPCAR